MLVTPTTSNIAYYRGVTAYSIVEFDKSDKVSLRQESNSKTSQV